MTRELREKIQRNVTDEALEAIERAEEVIASLNGAPEGDPLINSVADLRANLNSSDNSQIEQKTFDLISEVNAFETKSR